MNIDKLKRFHHSGFGQFVERTLLFLAISYLMPQLLEKAAHFFKFRPYYTIANLYVSLVFFMVLLLFYAHNKHIIKYLEKHHVPMLERLTFLLFAFLAFLHYFAAIYLRVQYFDNMYVVSVFNYFTYILGNFFLILTIFGYSFFRKFKKSTITALLVVSGFIAFSVILNQFWKYFSGFVISANTALLGLVSNHVVSDAAKFSLQLEKFGVIIGSPCSGIASLMMFTGLYIFAYVMDRDKINFLKFLWVFIVGAIGMFWMNIFRISFLMIIGAYYSPAFALSLFHENAGWIIFVIYFLLYYYFTYPLIIKKE